MEIMSFAHLTLGQRVRISRVARRWRQEDLADEACVTQAQVSALERDLPLYPEAKRRILVSLGLEIEDDHQED